MMLFLAATALVLLVAFGLRAYDLAGNPPELFEDELADAMSAWSIVTTGHDIERTRLPFLTTRLEVKPPIYGLSTVPVRALFGDHPWVFRLPAVLFGTAATALLIWLSRALGRGRAHSLLGGALFATLPWAVHHGRIGLPPDALLPFTLGGVGLLWIGLSRHGPRATVSGAAVLALGVYAAPIAPLTHGLLAALVVAVHARGLRRRDLEVLVLAGVVACFILWPYLDATVTDPFFTQRSTDISTFRDGVNAQTIGVAWRRYFEQWNPQWLFLSGPDQLRSQPGMAVAFAWTAPFFALGLVQLVSRRTPANLFVLGWLILGPLPAAVTNDGSPDFTRGLVALPAFVLVTVGGVVWAWERSETWRLRIAAPLAGAVVAVIAIQGYTAYDRYFTDYPADSAAQWYDGTGEALTLAGETVPAGGALCVDMTPGYTFQHYLAYYLDPRDFTVIEGRGDPRCALPETYLLTRAGAEVDASGTALLGIVYDISGNPVFALWRVVSPASAVVASEPGE